MSEKTMADVKCNVVQFQADTFNASMLTNLGPHPLSGEPTVNTVVVGGLTKRLGIAMHLLSGMMAMPNDTAPDDECLFEMIRTSLKTAQMLIDLDAKFKLTVEELTDYSVPGNDEE